jgi:hypothetical protein
MSSNTVIKGEDIVSSKIAEIQGKDIDKEAKEKKIAAIKDLRKSFLKLADNRLVNFQKQAKLIGNLASSQYPKSDDEIEKIREIMTECVVATMAKFDRTQPESEYRTLS